MSANGISELGWNETDKGTESSSSSAPMAQKQPKATHSEVEGDELRALLQNMEENTTGESSSPSVVALTSILAASTITGFSHAQPLHAAAGESMEEGSQKQATEDEDLTETSSEGGSRFGFAVFYHYSTLYKLLLTLSRPVHLLQGQRVLL